MDLPVGAQIKNRWIYPSDYKQPSDGFTRLSTDQEPTALVVGLQTPEPADLLVGRHNIEPAGKPAGFSLK